ncbi:MAG: fumarylacetoacetase [Fimbriimonas sp.]
MPLIPASAKTWLDHVEDCHFPIQNIPFGLALLPDESEAVVTRIGDYVIDICELAAEGLIPTDEFPILHSMIDLDREDLRRLRRLLFELFEESNGTLRDNKELRDAAIFPHGDVEMLVPMEIPQFVDFYAGINHASNVGKMFRPDGEPLLANYRHLPVGYNGRASSIVPSGFPIKRPKGQYKPADSNKPVFGPTKELDFELELGFFIGQGNEFGEQVTVEEAEDHMLGLVMVNDWSARDVQRWEYQPLGPFLAKSFATSVSPWIVTLDALSPFKVEGPRQDPEPLEHLRGSSTHHYNIELEVSIKTPKMTKPQVVCRSNARHLYWSFAQMLAHQTSNGTPTEPGDLYASGTISGPEEGSYGSMLELSWKGTKPILLQETGETRTFLEDGDQVIFAAHCRGDGYCIGFGEMVNEVFGAS